MTSGAVREVDGVAPHIGAVVGEFGTRAAFVTDRMLTTVPVVVAVAEALDTTMLVTEPGEPTSDRVAALAGDLASLDIDVVVAVGGGSVIDTVKLAARLVADPGGLASRLLAAAPFPERTAAVVAVPTTAGSGAEVTRTAIVTDHGRKSWAWDERLRPEAAVLSAEMTAATPRPVAMAAGLDAFSHALEASTGQRSRPAIRTLGFGAAAAVYRLLPEVLRREGTAGRLDLARAAAAAGTAIDQCGTGIGHAVGHAVGSVVAIPHGLAVALGLRAGLAWTMERASAPFDGLADTLAPGAPTEDLPVLFERWLAAIGFDEELARYDPPSAAEIADELRSHEHLPMRANNARPIGDEDLTEIAELTVRGWPR